MVVKTTLNLDDQEYRDAQRLAGVSGLTVGEYVSRALRDARLRAWHRRTDRDPVPASPSESPEEELERESTA